MKQNIIEFLYSFVVSFQVFLFFINNGQVHLYMWIEAQVGGIYETQTEHMIRVWHVKNKAKSQILKK